MTMADIQLPNDFTPEYEIAVINYLTGDLHGRQDWQVAFAAFDRLDMAYLETPDGRFTSRTLYLEVVDYQLADGYIRELLALDDVEKESPAVWSRYARQIAAECQRRGWQQADLPGARVLLSYLLYWWGAFARGYAFEVEIFRDLQESGIEFQAHDPSALLRASSVGSPGTLLAQRLKRQWHGWGHQNVCLFCPGGCSFTP
jgi:hypothetical protein